MRTAPGNTDIIDPAVIVKTHVFPSEKRFDEILRNLVDRNDETVFTVPGDMPEQFIVAIENQGAFRDIFQLVQIVEESFAVKIKYCPREK